jgi:hypothetical protein
MFGLEVSLRTGGLSSSLVHLLSNIPVSALKKILFLVINYVGLNLDSGSGFSKSGSTTLLGLSEILFPCILLQGEGCEGEQGPGTHWAQLCGQDPP